MDFPAFPTFNLDFFNANTLNDDELLNEVEKIESVQPEVNPDSAKSAARFATLNEKDLGEIVTNAEAKGTKRNTKWIVSTIEGNFFV